MTWSLSTLILSLVDSLCFSCSLSHRSHTAQEHGSWGSPLHWKQK